MIASISERLSAHERRTLLRGMAIVVSLFALSSGLPRYRAWRAATLADAEREMSARARVEASVIRFSRTSLMLSRAKSKLASLDSILLPGASTSEARTTLASAISEAAEGAEAQLGSIQVRTDSTPHARLSRIGARASVTGDIESLALFLESLEAGPPALAVREWSISGGTPSVASTQPLMLRMDVVVEGIARTPGKRPF